MSTDLKTTEVRSQQYIRNKVVFRGLTDILNLKCGATLPCDLSLIVIHVSMCLRFFLISLFHVSFKMWLDI